MSLNASAAPLGARNATLADLALLRDQQARKVDVVAAVERVERSALRGRLPWQTLRSRWKREDRNPTICTYSDLISS